MRAVLVTTVLVAVCALYAPSVEGLVAPPYSRAHMDQRVRGHGTLHGTLHLFGRDQENQETIISEAATTVNPIVPPPSVAPLAVARRSAGGYVGLVALGSIPLVDWAGLAATTGEPNLLALQIARVSYFSLSAIIAVYIGAQRQDIGNVAPVTGKSSALAPVFAFVVLGGESGRVGLRSRCHQPPDDHRLTASSRHHLTRSPTHASERPLRRHQVHCPW